MKEFKPEEHTIVHAYRGSTAHNMYILPEEEMSTDDVDYMGVFIAPIDYYFGLYTKENHETFIGTDDVVMYDIKKFFKLLLKSNPNVLSLLWNKSEMVISKNWVWDEIVKHRHMFSSKDSFKAFNGYAFSQIKKMHHGPSKGYMGEKRKKIFDKFGYDTKNASHLIRLLRMGTEFLSTGYMRVYRTSDRDELISIKRGEWTLDAVTRLAEKEMKSSKFALENSQLPQSIDVEAANDLLVSIMTRYFDCSGLLPQHYFTANDTFGYNPMDSTVIPDFY